MTSYVVDLISEHDTDFRVACLAVCIKDIYHFRNDITISGILTGGGVPSSGHPRTKKKI